jgi:hypothetical protein
VKREWLFTAMVSIFCAMGITLVGLTACSTSPKVSSPVVSEVKAPDVQKTEVADKVSTVNEKPEADGSQITCVHESDTRVLRRQPHAGGCNLNYTKYGKTASVAKSTSGSEPCEKIEQKIRAKLESVGYDCK